ncbi:peptidylprolyl isomerase [Taklimakanibacter deserti]|uniref:peptidylprolyl isomerase n=1 Tax=Taklimakanibacter deserti TaxID=2267839 RepID=UPI000E651B60
MLDKLRDSAKSWVAKVLLGLLAASFVVWGVADVFTFRPGSALATVGDQEISAQNFTDSYRNWLQNYQRQVGQTITPEQARLLGLDRIFLNGMIRDAALDGEADKMKLAISDQQIADIIQTNRAFHNSQGQFDPTLFREVLRQNGLSEAGYVAGERQRFLRGALADTVEWNFTPPNTLKEAVYRHRNEERDARYFVLRPAEQDVPSPSEQDLKTYWEKNSARYTAPEYRVIAVLKADPQDIAPKIQISDADLAAAYDKFKRDYFKPETRAILQIPFPNVDEAKKAKERIAAGTDFMALAKERGLTDADASLGEVSKDKIFDTIIADAAFGLAQDQVSDPVQGKLSVVLLKVTKINPEKQSTLDEVKNELTSRLQLEKAKGEVQNTYDAVEDARAQQKSFDDIAKEVKLDLVVTPPVDPQGLGKDGKEVNVPFKEGVLKQAFESDTGVENDALTTPSSGYVWYEVREVTPSAVKPFDTVKAQVESDWKAQKLREVALEKAKQLVERAQNGIAFETLAGEAKAEIKKVEGLKRNETTNEFGPEAVAALFSVPENGFAFAPEGDGKGAKIMQSQAVLIPTFDPNSEEAKTITKALTDGAGSNLAASYVADVQNELDVYVDENMWRQVTGANAN